MIKLVIFDIDGVLTDGSILINAQGQEQKRLNLKDIDGIYELKRRGYLLAAITGEETEILSYFRKRFPWDRFISGCKKKAEAVKSLCEELGVEPERAAYVGDGKYDLDALSCVGLAVCPADSIREARLSADVILSRAGGQGCVWELLSVLETKARPASTTAYFIARMEEHSLIFKNMASDQALMTRVIETGEYLVKVLREGGRLFLCGNGGSAADAQHIAAEFVGRFYRDRPALCAEALTVNTSILTAIGNDYGYERIFTRQLEAKARKGDILICLSTSGSSANVLDALRYAKKSDLISIMLTGESYPAELEDLCRVIMPVPSAVTPRIQEAHIFLGHCLAEFVEHALYGDK